MDLITRKGTNHQRSSRDKVLLDPGRKTHLSVGMDQGRLPEGGMQALRAGCHSAQGDGWGGDLEGTLWAKAPGVMESRAHTDGTLAGEAM